MDGEVHEPRSALKDFTIPSMRSILPDNKDGIPPPPPEVVTAAGRA